MLQLDLTTIAFEIINFLVLLWLLNRFFFKPVIERVRARAEEKQEIMREVKEDRVAAEKMRHDLEQQLASANERAAVIVRDARKELERERHAMFETVHLEAENILREAYREANEIRQQVRKQSEDDLIQAVLEISGQMIVQIAPEATQSILFEEVTKSIWSLGKEDMYRVNALRESLQERTAVAQVRTAKALSVEQQRELVQTLSALADRQVKLEQTIDPSLYLGLQIRLNDLVIENAISSTLDSLREDVQQQLEEIPSYERPATEPQA